MDVPPTRLSATHFHHNFWISRHGEVELKICNASHIGRHGLLGILISHEFHITTGTVHSQRWDRFSFDFSRLPSPAISQENEQDRGRRAERTTRISQADELACIKCTGRGFTLTVRVSMVIGTGWPRTARMKTLLKLRSRIRESSKPFPAKIPKVLNRLKGLE